MRLKEEFEKYWFKLPLKLRQRWWEETNYGKIPPSEELELAIEDALKEFK
jgi:hypothetical protein